jgi:hypothetical protein
LVYGPGVHLAILTSRRQSEELWWTPIFSKRQSGVDVLHRLARQD